MSEPARPQLSVVVTIVDGADALRQCLGALAGQEDPPSVEVLIPYDDSVADMDQVVAAFPTMRFLPMGGIATERAIDRPAGQHELYDRRRSVGLSAAEGDLICILEDRGIPEPGWARKVLDLHERLPHAVIGGAVECGVDAGLNWAVYFCDYGRYQLPFVAGPRRYVTDVNISYKRAALERTRELWADRYHETTVHWELERSGETLYLTPDLVVSQHRSDLSIRGILRERVEWGRLFAYTRVRDGGAARRLGFAVSSPILPVLLLLRHTRMQLEKRVRFGRFVRVSPLVALFLAAWSFGELLGYVSGKP